MIYLDNAATTFPKPEEVYQFMDKFYRNNGVSPSRSAYDLSIESEELVYETRKLLAGLFNGDDPERLTFSYNASDSLNMAIQGLVRKGDHVITTCLEHNSVLRPLHHFQSEGIVDVTYLSFDNSGYIDPESVKKAIGKNTRMVVINHCSNVTGTVQDLQAIGKICRQNGVLFVVDGSQSAGSIPVDVKAMGIDVFVFTGHKSLLGPTGIGGSYISEGVPVRGTRFGGTGIKSAEKAHLTEFPHIMECGTINILGISGLNAGVRWLLREGIEKIHDREMGLWIKLRDGLRSIPGVITFCADSPVNHNAIISFNINGIQASDAGLILDDFFGIACRTGLQCAPLVHKGLGTDMINGTIRFSLGPFNTESHIEKALEAVDEIASGKTDLIKHQTSS